MDKITSFGNYLLSKERKDLVTNNPNFSKHILESRLSLVSDADYGNWEEDNKD